MFSIAFRRGVPALALIMGLAACAGQQAGSGGPIPLAASNASSTAQAAGSSAPGAGRAPQILAKFTKPALPPNHSKSWISSDAASRGLIYVSDTYAHVVDVYSENHLKYVGQLTGFNTPLGECSDKNGNVWVADAGGAVYEYVHGYPYPIATLTQGMYEPVACAINPKTGDLAVANGNDDVLVFHAGSSYYTKYTDIDFSQTAFLGYDNADNLFVDGIDLYGNFHYAELHAGAQYFTDITLKGFPKIQSAGSVQWDGHHMTVGDTQSTIYRTKGSKVVSKTKLSAICAFAFEIVPAKNEVIAPDQCGSYLVGIYPYPTGGSPMQAITGGLYTPYAAVVSR